MTVIAEMTVWVHVAMPDSQSDTICVGHHASTSGIFTDLPTAVSTETCFLTNQHLRKND